MISNGTFCCDEHRDLYENERVGDSSEELFKLPRPQARRWRSQLPGIQNPLKLFNHTRPAPSPRPIPDFHSLHLAAVLNLRFPKPRTAVFRPRVSVPNPALPRSPRMLPPLVEAKDIYSWPAIGVRVPLPKRSINAPVAVKAGFRVTVTPALAAGQPLIPKLSFVPSRLPKPAPVPLPLTFDEAPRMAASNAIDFSTQKLREIWRNAPGDLKLIAMVIPMVLLLTLNAAGPKLYTKPVAIKASSQHMFDGLLTRQWHSLRKSIALRAGYNYGDDFHSGLDAWQTAPGVDLKWSYDNMGFVRPATLALFRPTLQLTDCEVEFTGRFEQKGLGFVFRAADTANYQAVKLVLAKPGPLPEIHLVRYTVINGKEGPRIDKVLPFPLGSDTFFTVRMEVRGSDFTLMIQDKMADFWSDDRLKTGGIGFFCGKGESARLRRVNVSYQNDTLGRFCAYIASEGVDSNNGS